MLDFSSREIAILSPPILAQDPAGVNLRRS